MFFLLVGLFVPHAYSKPVMCRDFLGYSWKEMYDRYEARFLSIARDKISSSVEMSDFQFSVHQRWEEPDHVRYAVVHPEAGKIAYFRFHVLNETLSFDITILRSQFKKSGLYGFLLGKVLRDYPQVTRIPVMRMVERNSENAVAFRKSLDVLTPKGLDALVRYKVMRSMPGRVSARQDLKLASQNDLDQLYHVILESLEAVPGIHVRRRYGFSRVTSVVVGSSLNFSVERGGPIDTPRVFLKLKKGLAELSLGARPVFHETKVRELAEFKDYRPD